MHCNRLSVVTFAPDSTLTRIEGSAFAWCPQLQSLVLPSSLEFIGERGFLRCDSLSTLAFCSLSTLRECLHLPMRCACHHDIPDSVEIVSLSLGSSKSGNQRVSVERPCERTLAFGRESGLCEVTAPPNEHQVRYYVLQFLSRSLKAFRGYLEFGC
jgi:hypothetical protein